MLIWGLLWLETITLTFGFSNSTWGLVGGFSFFISMTIYRERKSLIKLPEFFLFTIVGTICVVFANSLAVYLSSFFERSQVTVAPNIFPDAIHIITIVIALLMVFFLEADLKDGATTEDAGAHVPANLQKLNDPSVLRELVALEEELLSLSVRKDKERLDVLLSDCFFEIGASGRLFDKAAIIADLQTEVYKGQERKVVVTQ